MLRRQLSLFALAGLLCFSLSAFAEEYKTLYSKFKEVPGILKSEDGHRYIVHENVEYFVAKDEESKKLYFINMESQSAQWHDPRIEGPIPEPETINYEIPLEAPQTPQASSISVAIVAILPLLLFGGGTAARIAYLQMYYPERLWPTKERKDRRKASGGKVKPQKQRGKMNQDGKGGRSANS